MTITNNNPQPVAFKVKTTAPKVYTSCLLQSNAFLICIQLYCVRPNSGRVEPGETVEVSGKYHMLRKERLISEHAIVVMLQALKEDPPLNTKCKDKFLIQSTIITPEKEALPVHAIV